MPSPAPAHDAGESRASYLGQLLSQLNRFKHYPPEAKSARIEGVVMLHFIIDRSGRLLSAEIAKSSGRPALDARRWRWSPAPSRCRRCPQEWKATLWTPSCRSIFHCIEARRPDRRLDHPVDHQPHQAGADQGDAKADQEREQVVVANLLVSDLRFDTRARCWNLPRKSNRCRVDVAQMPPITLPGNGCALRRQTKRRPAHSTSTQNAAQASRTANQRKVRPPSKSRMLAICLRLDTLQSAPA